jgi:PAS domain S-box-containing protein
LTGRERQLLGEASHILAGSLDDETTLQTVARLAVESLADWCVVHVVEEDGAVRQVAVAHHDPAKVEYARELERRYPYNRDAPNGVASVLRSGVSELYPEIPDELVERVANDPEHARLALALGLKSAIVAPLVARGRTLGAITLIAAESGRRYGAEELELAEELAGRAALAVDNARLLSAAREQAKTMAAILDASVDHISVIDRAGRYVLVNEAAARAVGLSAAEMIGRTWRELGLRASSFERIDREREAVAASGLPERHELTFPGPEGLLHFEYVLAAVRGPGGEVAAVVAINRDITRRGRAEEERGHLLAAERAARAAAERAVSRTLRLQAVTAALSEAPTAAAVAAVILDQGLAALGARAGTIALLTPAGDELELLHAVGFPAEEVAPWSRFPLAAPVALAEAVRTAAPVVLLDHAARRARYPGRFDPDPAGDGALVALPLLSDRRPLGGCGLVFPEGQPFGAEDLGFAQTLAQQCAQALERVRLYEAERRARIDAEVANRAKDEFLAMLGHELRNPLAPTLHALEVLRAKGDDPAARGWAAEMLERQARHMARLVDDLLDISRITRGKIELRPEPVELAEVVRRAVESCRLPIEDRRHRLSLAFPPEPLWVEADPARLEQVLSNLLNNAAKYTPPGGAIALATERQGAEVVITVTDDGAGIPPEMLGRIFDLFHQVDPSLARSQGGLGIGLTLVRRLVEMHGGSVEARSEGRGRGSAFVIRLPLLDAPPAGAAARRPAPEPAASRPPGAPRRVLVVEDNVDSATALAELLRLWGHEVRVAHDGVTGLEEARAFAPDLVLLDIGLPGMDGYEVALALRAAPAFAATRLVALTGYGQERDHLRSREVGIDRHVTKPIDLAELRELLAGR